MMDTVTFSPYSRKSHTGYDAGVIPELVWAWFRTGKSILLPGIEPWWCSSGYFIDLRYATLLG
jgi:hypothetical protein